MKALCSLLSLLLLLHANSQVCKVCLTCYDCPPELQNDSNMDKIDSLLHNKIADIGTLQIAKRSVGQDNNTYALTYSSGLEVTLLLNLSNNQVSLLHYQLNGTNTQNFQDSTLPDTNGTFQNMLNFSSSKQIEEIIKGLISTYGQQMANFQINNVEYAKKGSQQLYKLYFNVNYLSHKQNSPILEQTFNRTGSQSFDLINSSYSNVTSNPPLQPLNLSQVQNDSQVFSVNTYINDIYPQIKDQNTSISSIQEYPPYYEITYITKEGVVTFLALYDLLRNEVIDLTVTSSQNTISEFVRYLDTIDSKVIQNITVPPTNIINSSSILSNNTFNKLANNNSLQGKRINIQNLTIQNAGVKSKIVNQSTSKIQNNYVSTANKSLNGVNNSSLLIVPPEFSSNSIQNCNSSNPQTIGETKPIAPPASISKSINSSFGNKVSWNETVQSLTSFIFNEFTEAKSLISEIKVQNTTSNNLSRIIVNLTGDNSSQEEILIDTSNIHGYKVINMKCLNLVQPSIWQTLSTTSFNSDQYLKYILEQLRSNFTQLITSGSNLKKINKYNLYYQIRFNNSLFADVTFTLFYDTFRQFSQILNISTIAAQEKLKPQNGTISNKIPSKIPSVFTVQTKNTSQSEAFLINTKIDLTAAVELKLENFQYFGCANAALKSIQNIFFKQGIKRENFSIQSIKFMLDTKNITLFISVKSQNGIQLYEYPISLSTLQSLQQTITLGSETYVKAPLQLLTTIDIRAYISYLATQNNSWNWNNFKGIYISEKSGGKYVLQFNNGIETKNYQTNNYNIKSTLAGLASNNTKMPQINQQQMYPNCVCNGLNGCVKCSYRFYLKNNSCAEVPKECSSYDRISGKCVTCYSGFILISNGTCTKQTQVGSTVNGQCVTCQNNYKIVQGQCQYQLNSDSKSPNYIYSKNPFCYIWNGNTCEECMPGAYLNSRKMCKPVDVYCQSFDYSRQICLSCELGYSPVNGRCQRL